MQILGRGFAHKGVDDCAGAGGKLLAFRFCIGATSPDFCAHSLMLVYCLVSATIGAANELTIQSILIACTTIVISLQTGFLVGALVAHQGYIAFLPFHLPGAILEGSKKWIGTLPLSRGPSARALVPPVRLYPILQSKYLPLWQ